jgi:hypothetical protein
MSRNAAIYELLGVTLTQITGAESGSDRIHFTTDLGRQFTMYHDQICCEKVSVEDVIGDVKDLLGSPLTMAEEVTNSDNPRDGQDEFESFTWTFYKFATARGYVTIRWYGTSNGCYSEKADFTEETTQTEGANHG